MSTRNVAVAVPVGVHSFTDRSNMTTLIKHGRRRISQHITIKISSVFASSSFFSTSTSSVSTSQQQLPSQAQCVVIGKLVVHVCMYVCMYVCSILSSILISKCILFPFMLQYYMHIHLFMNKVVVSLVIVSLIIWQRWV